ncbi:MAG: hypothetical protein H6718_24050 [Polyangiaceae bacterium]|nr:hypothetical protein [Myxococcales bacterium]MCB9588503.1 hypothetical protein [Polyangiaceae bacterium]
MSQRPTHRRARWGAAIFAALCNTTLASNTARAADADPWWGRDKALHFSVSAGLGAGGYGAGALFFDSYGARALTGAALSLSLGIGKEVYDATGAGDPSWKDLTWDVIGTGVGVGVALLLDLAIRGAPHPQTQSQTLQGLHFSW